ncbi:hypothetical protein OIU85_001664 [Salix viminalis]|uniref:Uncharacterized protein n=1 Tax=Salix viminalis TaxID=40686 RepID=A0A9Q0VP86_SALVM|nr:hypothetical protein OIU85_001664 [Salix viminalis]
MSRTSSQSRLAGPNNDKSLYVPFVPSFPASFSRHRPLPEVETSSLSTAPSALSLSLRFFPRALAIHHLVIGFLLAILRQTCLRQPSINMKLERKFKESGFGFSPVTNQFKVTRMISQCAHDAHTDLGLKHFKFHGVKSKFEVIVHTPSFISPKDALLGDDMQVLNINSRCAELKLQHVQSSFCGGTENMETESDSSK